MLDISPIARGISVQAAQGFMEHFFCLKKNPGTLVLDPILPMYIWIVVQGMKAKIQVDSSFLGVWKGGISGRGMISAWAQHVTLD
ncbi:MAG: hypothetical protein V5B78_12055 [Desulfohalobiaceae bacterium]